MGHTRSGSTVITEGVVYVALDPEEDDSDYRVALSAVAPIPDLHWEDKTNSGFDIRGVHLEPTTVDWIIHRN